LDKVDPRNIQEAAMVTARILLHVANAESLPAPHLSEDAVLALLKTHGLDAVLRLTKQWRLYFPSVGQSGTAAT
jgi:hypothetical protein